MSEQMGWCYACQEPRPRESLRLMRRDDGSLWEGVWVCDMHGDDYWRRSDELSGNPD
jgi:hypothetical protein